MGLVGLRLKKMNKAFVSHPANLGKGVTLVLLFERVARGAVMRLKYWDWLCDGVNPSIGQITL